MNPVVVEYARVLGERWRWVAAGLVSAVLAVLAFLIVQPPEYATTATVFVRTPGHVTSVVDGGDSYAQGRARTYAALVGNTTLAAEVIAGLGLDMGADELAARVSGTARNGPALMDVTVTAPDRTDARRIAAVLLEEYAETVRTLESVPGSLVPKADLVVVDPPGTPERLVAGRFPLLYVWAAAIVVGLVGGACAAVLVSVLRDGGPHARHRKPADAPPEVEVAGVGGSAGAPVAGDDSDATQTNPPSGGEDR